MFSSFVTTSMFGSLLLLAPAGPPLSGPATEVQVDEVQVDEVQVDEVQVDEGPAPKLVRVAVLYFDHSGPAGEVDGLKKALAGMIISDLTGSPQYEVVERDRLQAALDELKRSAVIADQRTELQLGKILSANYLLVGEVAKIGKHLTVNARLVETETGRQVFAATETGRFDRYPKLERKLAAKARAALLKTVGQVKAQQAIGTAERLAKGDVDTATMVLYARALEAKDQGDAPKARKLLAKAVRIAPSFTAARTELDRLEARPAKP